MLRLLPTLIFALVSSYLPADGSNLQKSGVFCAEELAGRNINVFKLWADHVGNTSRREDLSAEASLILAPLKLGGKGFSLLNSETFFPTGLITKMRQRLPKSGSASLLGGRDVGRMITVNRNGTTHKPVPVWFTRGGLDYGEWLARSINHCLDREKIRLSEVLFVITKEGEVTDRPWHLDGGYLAATVTLWGEGTEAVEGIPKTSANELWTVLPPDFEPAGVLTTPSNQTLVFTSIERAVKFRRAAATPHRPTAVQGRALLIYRFVRI